MACVDDITEAQASMPLCGDPRHLWEISGERPSGQIFLNLVPFHTDPHLVATREPNPQSQRSLIHKISPAQNFAGCASFARDAFRVR